MFVCLSGCALSITGIYPKEKLKNVYTEAVERVLVYFETGFPKFNP